MVGNLNLGLIHHITTASGETNNFWVTKVQTIQIFSSFPLWGCLIQSKVGWMFETHSLSNSISRMILPLDLQFSNLLNLQWLQLHFSTQIKLNCRINYWFWWFYAFWVPPLSALWNYKPEKISNFYHWALKLQQLLLKTIPVESLQLIAAILMTKLRWYKMHNWQFLLQTFWNFWNFSIFYIPFDLTVG